MRLSSEMIDNLKFTSDSETINRNEGRVVKKITETTEVRLEDYFTFLDDVVPGFMKPLEKTVSQRKVFELD